MFCFFLGLTILVRLNISKETINKIIKKGFIRFFPNQFVFNLFFIISRQFKIITCGSFWRDSQKYNWLVKEY
jgi:hypothetical protein